MRILIKRVGFCICSNLGRLFGISLSICVTSLQVHCAQVGLVISFRKHRKSAGDELLHLCKTNKHGKVVLSWSKKTTLPETYGPDEYLGKS